MKNEKCIICETTNNIKLMNNNPICENCYNDQLKLDKKFSSEKKNLHPECVEIIKDKLYLGNYDFAKKRENLLNLNITNVLVCGNELETPFEKEIKYMKIPLKDIIEDSILPYINQCCDFINDSKKILVHCNAGISRSPSIIIAYLIKEKKMKFEEAFNYVKKKRNIKPNESFYKELMKISQ